MFIILGIVAILAIYLIVLYNRLVGMRNRVRESFSAIDVYLQNRMDALTKVAEAVVSYASHERETLNQVTRMRAGLSDSQPVADKIRTYSEIEKKLSGINIQAEAYPELRANENYLHLQHTVNDLEEKLSASRRTFNANVTQYNTMIAVVPTNLFAGMMGFRNESLLEIEESKKQDVDMKALLKG